MSQNANGAGALASVQERRKGQRHMTVFKVARICGGDTDDLCLIRNISAKGVKVETLLPLLEGEHVTIEIRSDRHLQGVVHWSRDGSAGIQFDDPIDVEQTLGKSAARQGGKLARAAKQARAPRFARSAQASLRCERQWLAARVANISLSGAHIMAPHAESLHPSDHVTITIDGLGVIGGAVRWLNAESVGIQFDRPLPFRQFEYWLRQQDTDASDARMPADQLPEPGFSTAALPSVAPSTRAERR